MIGARSALNILSATDIKDLPNLVLFLPNIIRKKVNPVFSMFKLNRNKRKLPNQTFARMSVETHFVTLKYPVTVEVPY